MSRAIRVGLIGAGRWGKVYIQTLVSLGDRCRLTHLATRHPENAALLPHAITITEDWRTLMKADCEAVIIATPPHTHANIVETCLEAGKSCIVEKPLCLDVDTAERLHQRAQSTDTLVLVNHTQLFNPAYQTLKRLIGENHETVRAMVSEGMALGPFRTDTPALWDWGPHDVSLCLDLVGQLPTSLSALGGSRDPHGAPEMVSIRLEFSGSTGAWIHVGRLASAKRRLLSVFTDAHHYVCDDLAPDKLTVSSGGFSSRYAHELPEASARRVVPLHSSVLPMATMLSYFFDGLSGGDRTQFGMRLAVDVVRVLAACETAIRSSRPIVFGQPVEQSRSEAIALPR